MAKHSDSLPPEERERIGNLCDATGLNRSPQNGDSKEDVATASKQQNPFSLSCFEDQPELSNSGSLTQSATTSPGASPNIKQKRSNSSSNDSEARKTHQCPYCSKICGNKGGLEYHKKKCSENSNTGQSRSKSGDKHTCPYCGESYHSEAALEGHKRKSHRTDSGTSNRSSIRRHKCRYCKKKFKNKRRRAKHEKDCSGSKGSGGGSVGKSVKKDNRGERVAGKNPFADPKRLKDTGLHQGGG